MALIGFGLILIILSFLLGYTFRNYRLVDEPRDYTFTRVIGPRASGKTTTLVAWAQEHDCIVVVPTKMMAQQLGDRYPELTVMSATKAIEATKGDTRRLVIDEFTYCFTIESRIMGLLPRAQLVTMTTGPIEREGRNERRKE